MKPDEKPIVQTQLGEERPSEAGEGLRRSNRFTVAPAPTVRSNSRQTVQRVETLIAYARAQYELGLINEAFRVLEEATQETEQITHTADRVSVLLRLAELYAFLSHESRAESLLNEAKQTALQIVSLPARAQMLREVAGCQYRLGLPSQASHTLQYAFETELVEIRRMGNPRKQVAAFVRSAQAQARVGLIALAERTFEEAIHTAFYILDLAQRTEALRLIARTMSQTGRGDTAVPALFNTSDETRRQEALRVILREQVRAGQYERVLALALQMNDATQREELLQLAQAKGIGSGFAQLFQASLRLPEAPKRNTALSMLFRSQIQADRLQPILERIQTIEDETLRQEVGLVLAEVLLETDRLTKGATAIFQIAERSARQELVRMLAVASLQAKQVEKLLGTAIRIEDDPLRQEVFTTILSVCVPHLSARGLMDWLWRQRQPQRRAELLRTWIRFALGTPAFRDLMEAVLGLGDSRRQRESFQQLASVLHQNRVPDHALRIAFGISEPSLRQEALRHLLQPFLSPNELPATLAVVAHHPNATQRNEAVRAIVQAVGAMNQFTALLNALMRLSEDALREELLQLCALSLAESGWHEPALQTVQALRHEARRTETLSQMAQTYIQSGRYGLVLGMALAFREPNLRRSLLDALMSHFFTLKRYDLAMETAAHLTDRQARVEAYAEIAKRSFGAFRWGDALSALWRYSVALFSRPRR